MHDWERSVVEFAADFNSCDLDVHDDMPDSFFRGQWRARLVSSDA